MSYKMEKLGDHIDIISGYAFKSKDFIESGVPVVKIKNVNPPSVTLKDLSFVSEELSDSVPKFILGYDDVLIALTGSHINQMASVVGRVARVKYHQKTVMNQRVGKIVPIDSNDCDIDYVYYFLSQEKIKVTLASKAGGAANQANISPSDVKDLILPFPDIDIQRYIATTLKTYDDLIEINQKQINLLEESAQRVYKEWFIDFRFPGHKTKIKNENLPEGWREQCISDFGEIVTGKTPSTAKEEYYGGNIPFVKIPDMHDRIYPLTTESRLTKVGADSQKNKYIPKNSIMVSCIATVGLVNIAVEDCQTNQQINTVVLADQEDLYYAFFTLKRLKELLEGVGSNGATMTNVNKAKFGALKVIYPTKDLIKRFYEYCDPIFSSIYEKSIQEKKLIEARDRLLQKLMSEEIKL